MKLTFDAWMERIDLFMMTEVGLTHKGIEDQPYKHWYEDNVKALQAARWALERAGML